MITLRPYQEESIAALFDYWRVEGGNGLIVLPTGAGKSLVVAEIMRRLVEGYPGIRIFCVTHTRELITQNFQELLRLWPQAASMTGIYSAGVGRRDTRSQILFCGVQSVYNKVDRIGACDLLLVDEAHLIPRKADTMYGKFIERLRDERPDMRIAGLTATPYRLDSGRLDEGKDAIFDDVVYEANVLDLIDQGYLSPLISKASVASMDVAGLRTKQGEFDTAQAEERAMADGLVERAAAEMAELAHDRRAWLVFCVTVAHAEAMRDALQALGIAAESVDGSMGKGEREATIRRFREGRERALCSVNVLSIGFNVPHVDMVALCRPTKSTGMYIQQVGRAFRKAEGKENALILDFAKVVRMHGPVDAVVPSGSGGGDGKAEKAEADTVRAKECPDCAAYLPLNARECPHCGHQYPAPPPKAAHDETADDSTGILSTEQVAPVMIPVVNWRFDRHEKWGSPDSVRVTITAGLVGYSEWLPFEHSGGGRQRAQQWWVLHRGNMPFPKTVTEALERVDELEMPETVSVKRVEKYDRIVSRTFKSRRAVA